MEKEMTTINTKYQVNHLIQKSEDFNAISPVNGLYVIQDEVHHELALPSQSELKCLTKSVAHWHNYITKGISGPALANGSQTHTLLLEGQNVYDERYSVVPAGTRKGTKAWKEFEVEGKELVKEEDFREQKACTDALLNHGKFKAIFAKKELIETSFIASIDGFENKGVKVKGRFDLLTDNGWVVDFKTTNNATPYGFYSSCKDFRYHFQGAFYLDCLRSLGIEAKGFIFAFIEKGKHIPALYQLSEQDIERGREEYRECIDLYKHYTEYNYADLKSAISEGYSPNIETLTLPEWVYTR